MGVRVVARPNRRRRFTAPVVESDHLRHRLAVAVNNVELAERRLADGKQLQLHESVAELEQRLTDPGWQRFTLLTEQEFTVEGRRQMRSVCRLMAVANPLIRRGLSLRSAYVWGQGVEIAARANGSDDTDEQDIQAVVAAFLADDGNQRAFTSAASRDRLERTLGTDGEFYAALFTRPLTGDVQVRVVGADEITEIICNPEDRTEPWFYRRVWVEQHYTGDGVPTQVQVERLYPDVDHRPASRVKRVGTVEVAWDAPMLHINVNRPEHWQHGIPDTYSAINWARAYKTYLEQWAALMSALSKFAWRITAKGSAQVAASKARYAAIPARDPNTGEVVAGGAAITASDQVLEAIPKSGATIDSESGRPLAMMVAAALDVPVTMLLGDPGQTGARAVAETLDRPTELAMAQRREVWTAAYRRILRYVIVEQVRAPRGVLKGVIVRDRFADRESVRLAGDTDDTIDVVWPDLDETTVREAVRAVATAAGVGVLPPEVVLRLLLSALGVREADTIIEAMLSEDGEFLWPSPPPLGDGPAAATLARGGGDPAAAGSGVMGETREEGDPDVAEDRADQEI